MNRIKDFLKRFVLNYLGISSLIHFKKKFFLVINLKDSKKMNYLTTLIIGNSM
jgi:hypothetical protein